VIPELHSWPAPLQAFTLFASPRLHYDIRLFSKSFGQQEASYLSFSHLFFFYGLEVPLYLSHHYSLGVLSVILFLGGMHYGDPIIRPFIYINSFLSFTFFWGGFPFLFFLSLANDTHIFSLAHVVFITFDHIASQLAFVGLFIHVASATPRLYLTYFLGSSPLSNFYCLLDSIRILDVPFGFASFESYFL
jgi:hypothetical protein